jgi:NADPH:quinone reductase-like Zn-dependent oxidoreductase
MAVESPPREMRAARFHEYGPPSVLVIDLVPRPVPQEGEVLIRVRTAGVNPIDWKMRAGYLKTYMPVELPRIPGLDVAGTVEEVGSGVTEFAAGDELFGRGSSTYAEYATGPVATLARKPDGVSFDQAATLHVGGETAWVALFDTAQLEPGQRVLIQGGAGGVGSIAVQLAHWKGAHVIATTSTDNVAYVQSIGADEVVDYTAVPFEDVVHDVDVVIDTVGGEITGRSWATLKPGGIMVVVAGAPDAEAAEAHGVRVSNVRHPAVTAPVLEELARLVVSGDLVPHIDAAFPLEEAAQAQAASETGHGRGRIVLHIAS